VKAAQDAFAKLQQNLQQAWIPEAPSPPPSLQPGVLFQPGVDISILNVNITTGSGTSASTGSGQKPDDPT